MNCLNCEVEVSGKFCSNCGQRTDVKRITFKEGWYDFWARIYGFDGMFPRTIKDLTFRPGIVVRRYIDGNRAAYYGPVGYFFLMITLYLLVMSMLDVDIRVFLTETQKMFSPSNQSEGQQKVGEFMQSWVSNNLKLVAFFIMPFNAIASRFLFFRKSGLNFLEHLVTPFYVAGHVYWIGVISIFVYKFSGSLVFNSIMIVADIFLFGLAYTALMSYQPKWKAFLKGFGVYVMGQVIMISTVVVIALMIIMLLSFINPEALDFFRALK